MSKTIRWSNSVYTLHQFVDEYQSRLLPVAGDRTAAESTTLGGVLVNIINGSTGPNAIDRIASGQVMWVDSVLTQDRVYASDSTGHVSCSLPDCLPLYFEVVRRSRRGQTKKIQTIGDILRKRSKYSLPLDARVASNQKLRKLKRQLCQPNLDEFERSLVDDIRVIESVETEYFLRVNSFNKGVPDVKTTLVPVYLQQVTLIVAKGLVNAADDDWKLRQEFYRRACRHADCVVPDARSVGVLQVVDETRRSLSTLTLSDVGCSVNSLLYRSAGPSTRDDDDQLIPSSSVGAAPVQIQRTAKVNAADSKEDSDEDDDDSTCCCCCCGGGTRGEDGGRQESKLQKSTADHRRVLYVNETWSENGWKVNYGALNNRS
jgi:hypothetical protein